MHVKYVFLTHPHADHITGLIEVLKNYEVKNIYLTDAVHTSDVYIEFLRQVKKENIPVKLIRKEDKIEFQDDFYFLIFWPKISYKDREIKNLNNTSIVGKLVYKNISVLLTGDAENEVQLELIGDFHNKLKSDILKIPHQGARDSCNEEFLQIVNPELAIISVGAKNQFGHPHKITLEKLEKLDILTFRTDLDGTISIISDGLNFWKE